MIGRSDAERIAVALEHLDILHRHLERGELSDGVVVDAVSMRLSAAIEAVHGGDPTLAQRLFGIEWQDIWGMRNRLAHGYMTTEPALVADTIEHDLPAFERTLREELERLRDG